MCLSLAAGGICVVHIYVYPPNGPTNGSSWSARETMDEAIVLFVLAWVLCVSVHIDLFSLLCVHMCMCICVCPHWEYLLNLIIGWIWGMELWQSRLFLAIRFDHYLTFTTTSCYRNTLSKMAFVLTHTATLYRQLRMHCKISTAVPSKKIIKIM